MATPRFIFRGNAVVFGGRMSRPDERALEAHTSSSLPVMGGRAQSRLAPLDWAPYLTIAGGRTDAEGLLTTPPVSPEGPPRLDEASLASRTVVSASAEGIEVGLEGRVTIGRVSASLRSDHLPRARSGDQPEFLLERTFVDGLTVDGSKLRVHLNTAGHNTDNTYDKVASVRQQLLSKDARGRVEAGHLQHLDVDEEPLAGTGRGSVSSQPELPVTIFDRFEWIGQKSPAVRLEGHALRIEGFGTIFFGEMLITRNARRLTLVRMQLASPEIGSLAFSEVETNGSWYPPLA